MNKLTDQEVGKILGNRFKELKRLDGTTQAEFARLYKVPGGTSLISQHISGNRPIGLDAAICYANGFNCTIAEINPNLADKVERTKSTNADVVVNPVNIDELTINQYLDACGSMGNGVFLRDQPGQITGWRVTTEWVNKNIPFNTGKENLCIVTGFGDSMRGMFNSGDPLIVDLGVTRLEYDGVYFFRIGEEGFIKRLQRIPNDGIRVISKNSDYETWTITPDMDFEIFGRVLKVWKSEEF